MDILNDQAWLLTIVLQKRYNESNNFKKNKDVLYNSGHSVQLRKKKDTRPSAAASKYQASE